jgi:superfamily II DNA or RNA helicase
VITPRPYQTEAINAVIREWHEGVTRQLVSLPTGSGKTIIFALLAQRLGLRTLVLAHREELLTQAVQKIRMVDPSMNAGILRAEDSTGLYTDICVASVQTATKDKRIDALKDRGIRLCVVDEAHHAVARSYMKIFDGLGFMSGDAGKLLAGVTATAYRGDDSALGDVFEKVTFERTILSMMKAGYLCDARGVSVKTETDLSGVHTARGDFDASELSDVIDIPSRNELIAETYLKECPDRKAVVFCVGVEHARNVSEAFRNAGVASLPIHGEMERMERSAALLAYEKGDVRVLTNCAVLTEGWDDPATSAVMMARPTKSRALWVQCVGRGLRTYPGKKDCLIVDFADTAGRHNLCGIATLAGDPRVKPKQRQTVLDAFEEFEELEAGREDWKHARVGEVSYEEFDIMGRSDFVWTPVRDGHFRLPVNTGQSLWVRREQGGYMVWLLDRANLADKIALSDDPLPLGYAQGVAEDYIRLHGALHLAAKDAAWRKKSPTERQIETLKKLGIPHDPAGISSGEASSLIDLELARREASRNEPASHKQIWFIRHKLRVDDVREGLTKGEASRIIAEAKKKQEVA